MTIIFTFGFMVGMLVATIGVVAAEKISEYYREKDNKE